MSSTSPELGERQKRAMHVASSFGGRLFRKMVWYFIRLILYPYFRVRGKNAAFLDTPGPVILAPVHRSNLDAPLLVVQTPRMIHALAKESLFSSGLFSWVMAALGGVPVNRGAAGNHGSHLVKTIIKFDINDKEIRNLKIIELKR